MQMWRTQTRACNVFDDQHFVVSSVGLRGTNVQYCRSYESFHLFLSTHILLRITPPPPNTHTYTGIAVHRNHSIFRTANGHYT